MSSNVFSDCVASTCFNPGNEFCQNHLGKEKCEVPVFAGVSDDHCMHCDSRCLRVGTYILSCCTCLRGDVANLEFGVNEVVRGMSCLRRRRQRSGGEGGKVGTTCLLEMCVNYSRSWNVLDILLKALVTVKAQASFKRELE